MYRIVSYSIVLYSSEEMRQANEGRTAKEVRVDCDTGEVAWHKELVKLDGTVRSGS